MSLPTRRQLVHGRTFAQSWCPARYGAAVERHARAINWEWIGDVLLAVAIGIALGFCLAVWAAEGV